MPRFYLVLGLILFISGCSISDKQESPGKEVITTDKAPAAIGVYSQGIKVRNTIYVSGQIGLVPETRELAEDDLESQVRQTIQNIEAILQAGGFELSDVVSANVFLDDLSDYQAFNEIYINYFPENPPSRMVVEAARIPLDAKVEIKVIAAK
ncbi:MAG: Rid family detoxifying hydrolase [Balneola sp.]